MKKLSRSRQIWTWGGLVLFSTLLNFYGAFRSAVGLDLKISHLLESHLMDILAEKDDLELIDWENNLNRKEPNLSLRVLLDGKSLLSSGNLQWVPPNASQGVHFQFPDRFLVYEKKDIPGVSGDFFESFISLPLIPNPWITAGINLLIVFLTGLWFLLTGTSTPSADPAVKLDSSGAILSVSRSASPADEPSTSATLWVDQDYLIHSISKKAAYLFDKNPADVQGRHLLDLSPHPRLLEILKNDGKDLQRVQEAFLTRRHLNATVQADPKGWKIEILSSGDG